MTDSRDLGGALVTFGPGGEVVDIKLAAATTASGHIQLCNVSCSWFLPSKTASLAFKTMASLEGAERKLLDSLILRRKPECRLVPSRKSGSSPWCLKLGNLHVSTTERMLRGVCKEHQFSWIKFGEASHSSSTDEIIEAVKRQLAAVGTLESWTMSPEIEGSQAKATATATFSNAEEARKAVILDGRRSSQSSFYPFQNVPRVTT